MAEQGQAWLHEQCEPDVRAAHDHIRAQLAIVEQELEREKHERTAKIAADAVTALRAKVLEHFSRRSHSPEELATFEEALKRTTTVEAVEALIRDARHS